MGAWSLTSDASGTLTLDVPIEKRKGLLQERAGGSVSIPALHLNTVKYRQGPSVEDKIGFRVKLLRALRKGWETDEIEAKFLEAANMVDSDGCALFGGLVDSRIFERLVAEYDRLLLATGNKAFMHSYVNLAHHVDFLTGGNYVDAFAHPLFIAVVAYQMGGAIRIVDLRGKDTEPILINAQDNMLHVDNTPFKEEYKVLLSWERGQVKGPSGQNFTFLPGTHKGNRDILIDKAGGPWSTERDSLFISHGAIDGLFDFQERTYGTSRVVEATYPEQPLAALFPAGALVHHRYRTEEGNPRSCIIAAFHLSQKHPGSLVSTPATKSTGSTPKTKTLIEFLVGPQDANSEGEFLALLAGESRRIEVKLSELFFQPTHHSTLVNLDTLALTGPRLVHWRNTVVTAPNALTTKLSRHYHLSALRFASADDAIEALAAAMMYDKHGLLQLILYADGREEIRKPARKRIGEIKGEEMTARLRHWSRFLDPWTFNAQDLVEPATLRVLSECVAGLASNKIQLLDVAMRAKTMEEPNTLAAERMDLVSLQQLMTDLGEAITRCEGAETFVATSLFLFWTAEEIFSRMQQHNQHILLPVMSVFLRNYVAFVLIVELTCS